MYNNLYRLSTATAINNSGLGTNKLTKPAGVEVASIVPGKKYSVYIPSAATFQTDFNTDGTNYTVGLYAKPDIGEVLEVDGNVISYTGHSYVITNDDGEVAELGVQSNRAQMIVFTHSDYEAGIHIDSQSVSISASTTDRLSGVTVSVLAAGGLVDNIFAVNGVLTGQDIDRMTEEYSNFHDPAFDTVLLNDDNREFVERRTLIGPEGLDIAPMSEYHIGLDANEPLAFKVEYLLTGDGSVMVNGVEARSGFSSTEPPEDIDVIANSGVHISNLVVTEYYSDGIVPGPIAEISATGATGNAVPTHLHDDSSAAYGVHIQLIDSAEMISGWFKVQNGDPLPGVTMSGGVLTGSGLYVNGKPYSGSVLHDWYFLTRVATQEEDFTIDAPVHSITVSDEVATPAQIDDMYEMAFGNATITAPALAVAMAELPALMLSTEWDIVSSG